MAPSRSMDGGAMGWLRRGMSKLRSEGLVDKRDDH
uniref:Uncharacterized protein n=1 Tax=Arundo donax TaxID=35708 RepID=A0A0A9BIJ8_ARUDO